VKINLTCSKCAAVNGGLATFFLETIQDDGLYAGACPEGHSLLIATQTLRHEMLFEIALNAIKDGYYREAVSSFAASVERYFEFAIRVISKKSEVSSKNFELAWKQVKSQSERQVGAYIFAYVMAFREMPCLRYEKMKEFRNEVIHKGLLPGKRKTLEFGCMAYEVIQEGIQKLRAECLDSVNTVLIEHVSGISEKMGTSYPRTFQVTTTALNVIEDTSLGYKPFDLLLRDRGLQP
jgi:hypothetical protein